MKSAVEDVTVGTALMPRDAHINERMMYLRDVAVIIVRRDAHVKSNTCS